MRDPNTPTSGRAAARSRPVRLAVAVASAVTALGVLAAPAFSTAASSADELAFPYTNHFDSAAGGTPDGHAVIADGRLRLTDDVQKQAGAWSTDDTFPSDLGLEIEFEYAMWNDVGDPGADGLVLSLADGAAPQGVGAFGAALGYSCRHEQSQGGEFPCDLPGLPGAFAGIALDQYGNFSQPLNQSGPGPQAESVVIRGSGNGLDGYRYVDGVSAPGDVETEGPRPRKVRVTLLPGSAGELSVTVRLEASGAMRTVLDRVPLHGDGQAPLPRTLRLGFSAATGSHVNAHEIDALRVWQPADLAVEHDLAPTATAGDVVEYDVVARNVGPNGSAPSALDVDVPDVLQDVTWSCSADAGSSCGSPSGTGDVSTEVDLPRDGVATVTVRGELPAGTTGGLDSVATIRTAPSLADVDESDNVSAASATIEVGAEPVAHVETDKSVEPSTGIAPGDEVEYTVTARNVGPEPAEQVGAVDELPTAMRFVGSDDGCTASGQVVTCSSGRSLAAGESIAFRIRAALDPGYEGDGSDVVNVATATSPTDPDGGRPSPEVGIGVVDPDDGGPDDGGPGDGGPGDDGPGDDGGQDDARAPEPGGRAVNGTGALAYTGAEDLGLLAAIAGVAVAAGGTCWWLARRRRARAAAEDAPST
ncbi:conserved repeat domain-containing protein [Curtobacterium sp. 314Chir4.1]|uniref:lectin-like domain-containing protein n=1 Tax=Curtobacterium sp. 314Chir4.1 TaxID=1279028 RepID=UPI000BD7EDEB|nr:DUF11 domain-containing protein [Curtobacterium sp. 314Chir4.1]SOC89876.1 conserved repeat domain-containing protein [Curtobacterium sp. 314Chir4.1]